MADWEEIKRLAADFQKIQLSSTTQRLSERNCVEIVTWLVQRKLIDLIFTIDGKEYMTPTHLINDIKSELYVSGGRINLIELSKTIGVDLSHVTAHVNDITRGHKDIHSMLGQIIDANYVAKIAGEINEKLQQQGIINVNDLTIQYDLPAEFLQQQVLEKNLGKLIFGKQDKNDGRIFFTESFLDRMKAKIRGALVGLTRPTPISVILNHTEMAEKLFFTLFDQSSPAGILTTRLPGAQYVPNIYSKTQHEWVNSFYKQNGYLEYDVLIRLGISDYKSYLKKQLTNEEVSYLNSCVVSRRIIERAEADIDECINSKSFLDLQNNLPSVFNDKDIKLIIDIVLTAQKQRDTVVIDSSILSKAFVDVLSDNCKNYVEKSARAAVESGKYQLYQTDLQVSASKPHKAADEFEDLKADRKDERRKKAVSGKSGGGTQGRETKMKSTKKHVRGGTMKNVTADESLPEKKLSLELISLEDIASIIQDKLEDEGLDDLINPIALYLYSSLNEEGLEIAANLYASTVSDRTAIRRHTHNELQNSVNLLIGDVRLFEKGIKLLPIEVRPQLNKYLLKSLCTDVVSEILNYVSAEENLNTATDNFTTEQRNKFVKDLSTEYRAPMQGLLNALAGQDVEEFMKAAEDALVACSMILKKIDKKKDRLVVLNHKHRLLDELSRCDDPAMVLHLTTVIVFISATQNMLHISGRHVASALAFLKQFLSMEQAEELSGYHDLVMLMLSGGSESENAKEQLVQKMSVIKSIANEYKKPNAEKY